MAVKRACDLVVSSIGLVVSWPLMLAAAAAIKLTSPGPVVFRQERVGKGGRTFTIYKLRTMVTDAERHTGAVLSAGKSDARITPVGRFLRASRLDELPQLINVLRGDMSLVGPRPLLMEYLPLYSPEQARRHEVRPGITGWAQVNGRNELTWEERFELDVWYIQHRTLWLDLKILGLTLLRVLRAQGINEPGAATMTRFTGSRHGL
jgi:sugar transferase EpsL